MVIDKKELRKAIAEKHKKIADLQEELADQEDLLPDAPSNHRPENGFSPIYADKFQEVLEQLSKAEIKVMWEVKKRFDNHQAKTKKKIEAHITAESIHATLTAMGVDMSPDTVRKSLAKLVKVGFIKPLSESIQRGKRSTYRLNPFIAAGRFSEHLGKLQEEWKRLFP